MQAVRGGSQIWGGWGGVAGTTRGLCVLQAGRGGSQIWGGWLVLLGVCVLYRREEEGRRFGEDGWYHSGFVCYVGGKRRVADLGRVGGVAGTTRGLCVLQAGRGGSQIWGGWLVLLGVCVLYRREEEGRRFGEDGWYHSGFVCYVGGKRRVADLGRVGGGGWYYSGFVCFIGGKRRVADLGRMAGTTRGLCVVQAGRGGSQIWGGWLVLLGVCVLYRREEEGRRFKVICEQFKQILFLLFN